MGWDPSVGIPLAIAGIVVLLLVYFIGRPRKPEQGKRKLSVNDNNGERVEPTIGDVDAPDTGGLDAGLHNELNKLGSTIAERRSEGNGAATPAVRRGPVLGVRPASQPVERIITLYVSARPGEVIQGASLIVAAEKAGLVFGDKAIFHRLVSGRPEAGPIFSMANMIKPGNFDMRQIDELRTPGVCFFMALPGPLPALDGWDALLPTAQRLAELLDASVLDEERNALGRQRIAHIRDELRAYDRKYESNQIKLR
jgi:cell division protein ZipA